MRSLRLSLPAHFQGATKGHSLSHSIFQWEWLLLFLFPAASNCILRQVEKGCRRIWAIASGPYNTATVPLGRRQKWPFSINAAYSGLLYSFQYPNLRLISSAFNRKHPWSLDKAILKSHLPWFEYLQMNQKASLVSGGGGRNTGRIWRTSGKQCGRKLGWDLN